MIRSILFTVIVFFLLHQLHAQVDKERTDSLRAIMENSLVYEGKQPVYNFLLYANCGQNGFEAFESAGKVGKKDETPITPDYQYKIASTTKTVVATIILQLEEEGQLKTSDLVGPYLENLEFIRWSEFHIYEDTAYSDRITIDMLLQHTSGIADVFSDASGRFNLSVLLHKKRAFTSQSIIDRYFKYKLHKEPANKPGQGHHYSDINYMLLGFIIENLTGQSLAEAIRKRILEPLALDNTYFEYYEPIQGVDKQIETYLNKIQITGKINTSYEWAGGGLVSTTKDMGTFMEALLEGALFQNPATLEKMLDNSTNSAFGSSYGRGIYEWDFAGQTFYGHGGLYGSIAMYAPESKTSFAVNLGQANPPFKEVALIEQMLEIVWKK